MKIRLSNWQWVCISTVVYGVVVIALGSYYTPQAAKLSSAEVLARLSDQSLLLLAAGNKGSDKVTIRSPGGENIVVIPSTASPQQVASLQADISSAIQLQRDSLTAFLFYAFMAWLLPIAIAALLLKCFGKQSSYLIDGRLADVLALIQVLAIDECAHRSEKGLSSELQGTPTSGNDWLYVAQRHPEFFRVTSSGYNRISLVSRHVAKQSGEKRPPLTADQMSKLLELAVELHDREVKRSQSWHVWVPLIVAFTAGAFTLFGVWLQNISH